ncbi:50S ribosomal protein L4 [Mycobacterium talmoniae]|uniref:50S ribosomal protein L4 n=1 Tax=Mycobacterium talmoniae TaxID=1858794 RepID=A0A2S8BIM2_9MYCO|nr:50S ribosomal protein L4 [Mycobacterium talmoniae]
MAGIKIDVKTPAGKTDGSVELPAELFDAPANIALMHQVVVAQRAAARQGTHSTRPAVRSAAVAVSRTGRRAPAAPGRVRPGPRSSPVVVWCTAPSRATTASAPRRR